MLIVGIAGGALMWFGIRGLLRTLTTISFYEHAAVRRRFGREIVIRYVDTTSISYGVAEQRHHGARIGAVVTISLEDSKRRRIAFTGNHRERVSGMFSWRKVESIDELDSVRDTISEHIADAWEVRVLNGEEVPWCGRVLISEGGLATYRGDTKSRLTPWGEIVRSSSSNQRHFFHRRGESDAFVRVSKSKANFLPGLMLIHRLLKASRQPTPPSAQTLA